MGIALVWTLLASEPAWGSVSANAASFRPAIKSGSHCRFSPRSAEQNQGANADALVGIHEDPRRGTMSPDNLHDLAITLLREFLSAEFRRRGHPQHADFRQTVDHLARDVGIAVDRGSIDLFLGELSHLGHRLLNDILGGRRQFGVWE